MSIFAALIEPITGLVSKFIPDRDKAAALSHDLATLAEKQHHEAMIAQLAVNKQEAAHKSLFVAGWRPFIGWVCGAALANNFLVFPILLASGIAVVPLDLAVMMPVLMGMLGLGGLRTFEKVKQVSREK
jgi:hypothetical protein